MRQQPPGPAAHRPAAIESQRRAFWRPYDLPIAITIILPYLLLTIILGVAGTYIVTRLVADTLQDRMASHLAEASRSTFDDIERAESQQLNTVRAIANTQGLVEAAADSDRDRLRALTTAIMANQGSDWIELIDRQGDRLVVLVTPPGGGPDQLQDLSTSEAVAWPLLPLVLSGAADGLGDKRAAIVQTEHGPLLTVAGPLKTGDEVVGAVVVGAYVERVVARLQRPGLVEAAIFWPDGQLMASSFRPDQTSGLPAPAVVADVVQREHGLQVAIDRPERPLRALIQPFSLRDQTDGVLLVAIPDDLALRAGGLTRLQIVLLFSTGMLLVVVVGVAVARTLISPIERLVATSRAVAAGDLSHRTHLKRGDEIGQLASAFDAMTASLRDMHLNTVKSLAAAIDAKDPYTHGHSARVADYAVRIARHIGLPDSDVAQLEIGAYLHDVGKIGMADAVLLKPGRLTDDEYGIMKRHPQIGADILRPVGFHPSVMDVVLYHHERINGRGFPHGLSGADIPLLARIVCVCDAYDAMATNRAYRDALASEQVLAELHRCAGSQFDLIVVDALIAVLDLRTTPSAVVAPVLPPLVLPAGLA